MIRENEQRLSVNSIQFLIDDWINIFYTSGFLFSDKIASGWHGVPANVCPYCFTSVIFRYRPNEQHAGTCTYIQLSRHINFFQFNGERNVVWIEVSSLLKCKTKKLAVQSRIVIPLSPPVWNKFVLFITFGILDFAMCSNMYKCSKDATFYNLIPGMYLAKFRLLIYYPSSRYTISRLCRKIHNNMMLT